MPKPLPRWVAHTGLDYTVVMLGDECTENASLRVFGDNPEELGKLVADALNLMTDLAVAAGKFTAPEEPRKGQTRPSAEMAQGMARRLANSTADAYSHDTYGHEAWLACCALLLRRGYSEREADAIMRSKWTRWAADGASTDKPGAEDLARFLDNPRNQCTPNAVQELVTGTFTD